jgi:hypothetical protein
VLAFFGTMTRIIAWLATDWLIGIGTGIGRGEAFFKKNKGDGLSASSKRFLSYYLCSEI